MSLKPRNLATADLAVALKPLLGYEQQLFVSTQQHTELGTIEVVAPNSGTYTPNQADNLSLAAVPQELMVVLNNGADLGSALTITVNGTDSSDAALQGVAVFQPPTYSQDQTYGFPRGWAHEVTTTIPGKKFKTVLSVAIGYAGAALPELRIFGVPSLDNSAQGTFRKIAVRVSLNYDPQAPMPTAVQDGREKGKYIKAGEIEVGTLEISAKVLAGCEGLARVNGRRVCGWIQETKESVLNTQNILVLGLIMTSKAKVGESIEPVTLDATAMYEVFAFIMAH